MSGTISFYLYCLRRRDPQDEKRWQYLNRDGEFTISRRDMQLFESPHAANAVQRLHRDSWTEHVNVRVDE